jgi:hypothetical protein
VFQSVRRWLEERTLRQRATAYVAALLREPDDADVRWLAGLTGGDDDHARWELRYARRVLGYHVAGRDALDDRTASVVAEALTRSWRRDPNVAADKHVVVERQLNARLRGYADAMSLRGAGEPTSLRLARVLLSFAGARHPGDPAALARAGELLATYLADAHEGLRDAFGAAALPDDVAPSALAARAPRA